MKLGYNTNGFSDHALLDCLDILHEIGYRSVALTLDHHALNPFDPRLPEQLAAVRARLRDNGLSSVVETGARFLLDPRHKHEPTLVSPDPAARRRRVEFLCRAVDVAAELESECVSLWSGIVRDDAGDEAVWRRLTESLGEVLEYAAGPGIVLGFEPEPGMFVATLDDFQQLAARVESPLLQLTLDVGHLFCQHEDPLPDRIVAWRERIVNVHIEDMRRDVHEHLMFGEGELVFEPLIAAFRRIGYQGGLHVELSRHSHNAPVIARRAYDFLNALGAGSP